MDSRLRSIVLATSLWASFASAPTQAEGIKFVGRWLIGEEGAAASYAGSEILLSFSGSSSIAADFAVSGTQLNRQDLYISVTVDGGKPTRIALAPGRHAHVVLAQRLSLGIHLVVVRKEGEPYFGMLRFTHPTLDPNGRWQKIVDDRPIIEVIGDSDATGICALGPDSPLSAANLFTAAWASQAVSWVGLLEAELAGVGHPVDMVDLAISGSNAKEEAAAYDYTAYLASNERFAQYAQPGRAHASLVLLWGGANDRHGGGDSASGRVVSVASLSPFQRGIYVLITKVLARNPDARLVLLDYIDPTIPSWQNAYDEVTSLFPDAQRARMFRLSVRDPKNLSDACEVDPKGHPNLSMHTTWATQILTWMMSGDVLQQLGFPAGEQWSDE